MPSDERIDVTSILAQPRAALELIETLQAQLAEAERKLAFLRTRNGELEVESASLMTEVNAALARAAELERRLAAVESAEKYLARQGERGDRKSGYAAYLLRAAIKCIPINSDGEPEEDVSATPAPAPAGGESEQ